MGKRPMVDYFELSQQKPSKNKDFYTKVYEIAAMIPRGKVTSYGAIAEALGLRSGARVVGMAMGAVPEDMGIAAHRVLNRVGALTAAHKFGGYKRMRRLLEAEGVTFKDERVDMDRHFWKPG